MIALSDYIPLTPEAYLEYEEKSPIKHEYINGEVYAMAGTTDTHNTIAGNVYSLIRNSLRSSNCRVYFADIKVRLEQRNCFYYPDLFVTCHPEDQKTSTYKSFPKLIIEVLSDSTEAFDRGDKFNDYQTLETLEEYVLINSKHQRVEIFKRDPQGSWLYQSYIPTNETVYFSSLNFTLHLTDIYEDLTLD